MPVLERSGTLCHSTGIWFGILGFNNSLRTCSLKTGFMPGMDGTELTRPLFKALPGLPVVIFSFYDLPELQSIGKAAGVHLRGVEESFLLSWSD